MSIERDRLDADRTQHHPWKHWGPYLSERQWGTVREDYSAHGDFWTYLSHDDARSRAYRWGEDGLAGWSDWLQRLCLSLGLWNGVDPILKERLFGLTNGEGNHGEDVKELFYFLDATPTHSYLKMLYKYPQSVFPYDELVQTNRNRNKQEPEFELLDTGVFADDRYFDIFVEYAKAGPEDVLMQITAHNRGPDAAPLHILPQLLFRNSWSWEANKPVPSISRSNEQGLKASHDEMGDYHFFAQEKGDALFCDNETNASRLFGVPDQAGYHKDAFHDYLIHGKQEAINPQEKGTKAAWHFHKWLESGEAWTLKLRLSKAGNGPSGDAFKDFDSIVTARLNEANEFYDELQTAVKNDDERAIQRQAFAGMIWCKQVYYFDVRRWLEGDPDTPPPPPERKQGRDKDWKHLNSCEVLSMPDSWEYPWFAAWDLAFHCLPLALIDPEFAKRQLVEITREWFMHPDGQLPAYEAAFGQANPPVHAWAAWRVYQIDKKYNGGKGDLAFLERVFHKLMLNFTWWVNRKDEQGNNLFQGGFLGLDNIGVFDRSETLPSGGFLDQADGTSWMAMYALNLLAIALELARHDAVYEDIASKFFEHFLQIAEALNDMGTSDNGLWNEEDQFYYDELNLPDGQIIPLKVRSIVGLIPLFAVETLEPALLEKLPAFAGRLEWFLNFRPELAKLVSHWDEPGGGQKRLLSLLRGHRMKALLKRMLDETEFLSPHGVRALSKYHLEHPFTFSANGTTLEVKYEPAESRSGMFGGNSNWRGPVWMPINYLAVESLNRFHSYYGDDFKVECPTGSGKYLTLSEVADELARRLKNLFTRDHDGKRAVYGGTEKLQSDPNFNNYILFHEYFNGDDGAGLGASHQTGWTGLVAQLIQQEY